MLGKDATVPGTKNLEEDSRKQEGGTREKERTEQGQHKSVLWRSLL
jgi:hypothetical protein